MNTAKTPKAPAKVNETDLSTDIDKFLAEAEAETEGDEFDLEMPGFDMRGTGMEAPPGSAEDIKKGQKELDAWDRMVLSEKEEDWEIQLEDAMIAKTEALLLLGESGVGKTTMIQNLAKKFLKTDIAYFNAPTMDPFIHLVGVPDVTTNPDTNEKFLAFVRKSGIEKAELLVLDEINRVPPETQNALFELVATRKINGEEFGALKMVWGAMNPPRSDIKGRTVQDVEDAFRGRFLEVIPILAKPKLSHYVGRKGIGADVAHKCLKWWYQYIQGKSEKKVRFQDIITPRVLEYIMIKLQTLENRMHGRADPRHRPMTPRIWNVNFDAITHHNKLSSDTLGVSLPFPELRQMFLGRELYSLSSLMNDSREVDGKIQEIQDPKNPDAGKMACDVILAGISSNRLRPEPLIQWYKIGQFSRVLCACDPNDANIVINGKPDIAGFLFNKCVGNDATKRHFAKNNPNHPVFQEATPEEWDIYKHLQYTIDNAVKESARQATTAGGAAAGQIKTTASAPPKGAKKSLPFNKGKAPRPTLPTGVGSGMKFAKDPEY